MIQAVIFDLDGMLVKTEQLKARSYAKAAKKLRPELNEIDVIESFKNVVGRSRREVTKYLMNQFNLHDSARARRKEFGVNAPWQAYVQLRL